MRGQAKFYLSGLMAIVMLAGATAALGQEVAIAMPQDGEALRGTVLLQGTKPEPGSGWVSFVVSGGSLARPELVAAVAPPGGGRTMFEHRWDTAERLDGKRRFPDGAYTLTMIATGATGDSLGQQSIQITIQNDLPVGGPTGLRLRYLYPKNREVPYEVTGRAKLSSGDEDSWTVGGAAGGYGGEGEEGYGGYAMAGPSAYGGYGGYGEGGMGMEMAPALTLGEVLSTLSGRAKALFRARVMGIYVPESRPTELGGIVRDFLDVGHFSMRMEETRNMEGVGDYFTMLAHAPGQTQHKRSTGGHYAPGELFLEIPQGRTYSVGDSWSSRMMVIRTFADLEATQATTSTGARTKIGAPCGPKVIGQHEIQAVEWLHGRKCVRIHSTYEYKGDTELKLADWVLALGGPMGGMGGMGEEGGMESMMDMGYGGYGMMGSMGYGGYGAMGSGGMGGEMGMMQQQDPRIIKCKTKMTGEQTMHFAFELGRIERVEQTNKHELEMDVSHLSPQPPQMAGGYGGYGEEEGYGYGGYPGGYGGPGGPYGAGPGGGPPGTSGMALPRPPRGYPRGGEQAALGTFGPVMPNVGPAGEVAAGYRPRLPARGTYGTGAPAPTARAGYPGPSPYGGYGYSGGYGGSMPGAYGGMYGGYGGYGMMQEIKIDRDYEVHVVIEARD